MSSFGSISPLLSASIWSKIAFARSMAGLAASYVRARLAAADASGNRRANTARHQQAVRCAEVDLAAPAVRVRRVQAAVCKAVWSVAEREDVRAAIVAEGGVLYVGALLASPALSVR